MLRFRGCGGFRRVECTEPRPSAPEFAAEVDVLLSAVGARLFWCRRGRFRGLLGGSFNGSARTSGAGLWYDGSGLDSSFLRCDRSSRAPGPGLSCGFLGGVMSASAISVAIEVLLGGADGESGAQVACLLSSFSEMRYFRMRRRNWRADNFRRWFHSRRFLNILGRSFRAWRSPRMSAIATVSFPEIPGNWLASPFPSIPHQTPARILAR